MSDGNRSSGVYGLLGLAAKRGAVVSGQEACAKAIRNKVSGLMILAADSSANTRERFINLSNENGGDYAVFGSQSELGKRIGKADRSVLIVTDLNFARGISAILQITNRA